MDKSYNNEIVEVLDIDADDLDIEAFGFDPDARMIDPGRPCVACGSASIGWYIYGNACSLCCVSPSAEQSPESDVMNWLSSLDAR